MIVATNRPQQLHLVAIASATPVAQAEPKVFTPDFRQRLATLTHAERELRSFGLQVLWSRLAGPKPQAHFLRDAKVSIGGLLDRMGPRSFRKEEGYTVASGEFEGVIVSWCEPI